MLTLGQNIEMPKTLLWTLQASCKTERKIRNFYFSSKIRTIDKKALQRTALDFSNILLSFKARLGDFEFIFKLARQRPFVHK